MLGSTLSRLRILPSGRPTRHHVTVGGPCRDPKVALPLLLPPISTPYTSLIPCCTGRCLACGLYNTRLNAGLYGPHPSRHFFQASSGLFMGSSFLGRSLGAGDVTQKRETQGKWFWKGKKDKCQVVSLIKRRKDPSLDRVIEVNKKVRLVTRIKEVVQKQPMRMIALRNLGAYRKYIGLQGRRRIIALLRRYPDIFHLFRDDMNQWVLRFTKEAEEQFAREEKLQHSLEGLLVNKLRKLLMMSVDKRILLSKIAHVKRDFGLPEAYETTLLPKYPHYFQVVDSLKGPMLELTSWDPALAVTAQEAKRLVQREEEEEAARARREQGGQGHGLGEDEDEEDADSLPGPLRRHRPRPSFTLPKGFVLKKRDKDRIRQFVEMEFVSPYSEWTDMAPTSPEAEKRAVAVVHEMLSMTIEKRLVVDALTHFRSDYKWTQRLHGMLIRHPEVFYVSLKGQRDSVFLREAYDGDTLIERDPLLVMREELARLVAVGQERHKMRGRGLVGSEHEEEEGEDEEEEAEEEDSEDEGKSFDELMDEESQGGRWKGRGQQGLKPTDPLEAARRLPPPQERPEGYMKGKVWVDRKEAFANMGPREKW